MAEGFVFCPAAARVGSADWQSVQNCTDSQTSRPSIYGPRQSSIRIGGSKWQSALPTRGSLQLLP